MAWRGVLITYHLSYIETNIFKEDAQIAVTDSIYYKTYDTYYIPARRFPLGHMPTLEIDDQVMCQSNAIYRYLASEFNMYGSNAQEQAVIDQVCDTLRDLSDKLGEIIYHSGLDETNKVRVIL